MRKEDLLDALNQGKEIFFGNISVLMLKDLNLLILGLFTGNAVSISTYSIAEKILKSFQAAMRPLNSFVFPIGIRKLKSVSLPNKSSFLIVTRLTVPQFIVLGFASIVFFVIAYNYGSEIVIVRDIENLNLVLSLCSIMIFATFFGVSNYMYGTLGLNHLGGKKYYAKSIFLTGVLCVAISFLLIRFFLEKGAAVSYVLGEVLLLCFILKVYYKNNFRLNRI